MMLNPVTHWQHVLTYTSHWSQCSTWRVNKSTLPSSCLFLNEYFHIHLWISTPILHPNSRTLTFYGIHTSFVIIYIYTPVFLYNLIPPPLISTPLRKLVPACRIPFPLLINYHYWLTLWMFCYCSDDSWLELKRESQLRQGIDGMAFDDIFGIGLQLIFPLFSKVAPQATL